MSTAEPSSRFFGLDLHTLWPEIRRSWQELHRAPALAWLTPDLPVRVLHADGHEATWLGGKLADAQEKHPALFDAIELPEDILLRRTLRMPAMSHAQIAQAVEVDLRSVSPFAVNDMVWGYRAQPGQTGGIDVNVVLVSRKQAEQYIETQQHRLAANAAPEVWAFTPNNAPILLQGWGEARRVQHGAKRRRIGYGLLASVLFLVCAIAITPTMQLRLRALQAVYAYDAVQARTAPLLGQREAFVRSIEELEVLRSMLTERVDSLLLMEAMTQTLPDDTSLQSLQVQGLKVTINGLTANSATLMQLLGNKNGFKNVRAPSAANRSPGAAAENFIIEFELDPAVFSMAASMPLNAVAVDEPQTANTVAPADGATPALPPAAAVLTPAPAPAPDAPRPKSPFSSGPESTSPAPAPSAPAVLRKGAP